jgi:hypothetical protein
MKENVRGVKRKGKVEKGMWWCCIEKKICVWNLIEGLGERERDFIGKIWMWSVGERFEVDFVFFFSAFIVL